MLYLHVVTTLIDEANRQLQPLTIYIEILKQSAHQFTTNYSSSDKHCGNGNHP